MRVIFCGDRHWTNKEKIVRVMKEIKPTLVIHGGARGADSLAGEAATENHIPVLIFQAEWSKYGKAAGPMRNHQMIVEGQPDLVVAFHDNIRVSKGTKDMLNQAAKYFIETKVYDSTLDPVTDPDNPLLEKITKALNGDYSNIENKIYRMMLSIYNVKGMTQTLAEASIWHALRELEGD